MDFNSFKSFSRNVANRPRKVSLELGDDPDSEGTFVVLLNIMGL